MTTKLYLATLLNLLVFSSAVAADAQEWQDFLYGTWGEITSTGEPVDSLVPLNDKVAYSRKTCSARGTEDDALSINEIQFLTLAGEGFSRLTHDFGGLNYDPAKLDAYDADKSATFRVYNGTFKVIRISRNRITIDSRHFMRCEEPSGIPDGSSQYSFSNNWVHTTLAQDKCLAQGARIMYEAGFATKLELINNHSLFADMGNIPLLFVALPTITSPFS
jgi:hypothetical protein